MNYFPNFLRFFRHIDEGDALPQAMHRPELTHAPLPAVQGDTVRVLLAPGDIAGYNLDKVQVHIFNTKTSTLLLVGSVRRQDSDRYTEMRIRVNSAPKAGEYKQFALMYDTPYPKAVNLALNRPIELSTGANGSGLVDGDNTTTGYQSPSSASQYEVSALISLAVPSKITEVALWPWMQILTTPGVGFPLDMTVDVSSDNGGTFSSALVLTNLPYPGSANTPTPLTYALPIPASNVTHVKVRFPRLTNYLDFNYWLRLCEIEVRGYAMDQKRPALGTFRQQIADLDSYIRAIKDFYESYPHTPVTVRQNGNELTIRAWHSDKFKLGNVPLSIGIGNVKEQNDNYPTLTANKVGTVPIPAQDTYTVSVGTDIAQGNLYRLNGKTYTAIGTEKPADIIRQLGIDSTGFLILTAGASASASAELGTYQQVNSNRPTMEALYDSTSGGNDLYKVIVGADVVEGNVYQIAATGMATKTKTAGKNDTKATIEAFFNTSGSPLKCPVPAGNVPTVSIVKGSRTVINGNRPAIELKNKKASASATLDEYLVFIGSSIRRGNTYSVGTATTTAVDGDTPLSIAKRLGYQTHPMRARVTTGTVLNAYAQPGKKYGTSDIADITVLGPARWRPTMQAVCEFLIPKNTPVGNWRVFLIDPISNAVIARSNLLAVRKDTYETALLRWSDDGQAFGFEYQESGLTQQIRLPICLREGRPKQSESVTRTIDNKLVRGKTTAEINRQLISEMMPESFHLALWAALKHRHVWIDGQTYRCEGEVSQTEASRKKQLMQSTAELTETTILTNQTTGETALFGGGSYSSESIKYAFLNEITGGTGLEFFLQADSIVRPLYVGQTVSAGAYKLLVRCTSEPYAIGVYVGGSLVIRSQLTARLLNRLDQDLLLPAGSIIDIVLIPMAGIKLDVAVKANTWLNEKFPLNRAYTNEFDINFAGY